MVQRPEGHRGHHRPGGGHPVARHRRHAHLRGSRGRARCPRGPARWRGRPRRAGGVRARLRDSQLPHRDRPRHAVRGPARLVRADRLHDVRRLPVRLAEVDHPPGDRSGDRRHRGCLGPDPQLGDRRHAAGLRAHAAQPWPVGDPGRLQARAAQRGRPRPVRPRGAVRRPAQRRGSRGDHLRDPRPGPGRCRRHQPGRHPAGDGPGDRHRGHRRRPQPPRRPAPGLAEPEGACRIMTTVPVDSVPGVATLERAAHASLFRKLLKNPTGVASLGFLVLLVLAGIFQSLLAPKNPDRVSATDVLAKPGGKYLLGADSSGHDILSRLIYAIRPTLTGAAVAVVVAAVIGITAGLVSGYYGKWFAGASSWTANLLMSLPGIVVLLAARAVLGPSLYGSMTIFGILLAPAFYWVVYSAVSAVRHELYVDAARVAGLSDARIISRHILTVVRAPAIILAASVAGIAIAIQSGLDFLGLGDLSNPTWGAMLADAFTNIFTAPLNLLWPSLAIGLTCTALALLANTLRDILERSGKPKRRRRGKGTT